MRWVVASAIVLSVGCRSAPVLPPAPRLSTLVADADAALLRGCYACLIEARDLYEKSAVGTHRADGLRRMFEADLLLALREKELAMDPSASIARAREILAEPGFPIGAERSLLAVDAIWNDSAGWPRSVLTPLRRRHADFIARLDEEIDAIMASTDLRLPARQYLALTLDCVDRRPFGARVATRARVSDSITDPPPLVAYRAATCDALHAPVLTGLLAADSRFAEIAYFLGWAEVVVIDSDGDAQARAYAGIAHAAFPQSPAVTYLAATIAQVSNRHDDALRFFDGTIALQDVHEGAALGRTATLTQLGRAEEAIASATRMIDLRMDNADMALYWRAWNRRILRQLDLARQDIDAAKIRRSTTEIRTLAGVIEHDQGDLAPAKHDLLIALGMSGGAANCTAMEYLGLVHMREADALSAAARLDDASECHRRRAEAHEAAIRRIQLNDRFDEETKAVRIARLRLAIAEELRLRSWAAINGANAASAAGDRERATRLMEIAAPDPRFADQVATLRAYLTREN